MKKGTLVIQGDEVQLKIIMHENSSRAQIYGLTMKMNSDEDKPAQTPPKGDKSKGKGKKKGKA